MKPLALYIHWPFCKSKCPYCDFNSHVRDGIDHDSWSLAYIKELDYFAKNPVLKNHKVTSIFFGGGTPSLMPPSLVCSIIDKITSSWSSDKNIEITLEANPTSVEAEKLKDFKKAGINRVSLGIQAFNDPDLKFLGRQHSSKEALEAIKIAANTFDNYSFDLIYARPNQTVGDWKEELRKAFSLCSPHLSLYQLTIEKGTPFYSEYNNGKFNLPDNEIAAELYEITQELCNDAGMPAYEVSNHAKLGFESKHNISYWRYDEYIGIGPGAHSRISLEKENQKSALMMIHNPENWLASVTETGNGIQNIHVLNKQTMLEELVMMGIRLRTGINKNDFYEKIGSYPEKIFPEEKLKKLHEEGLIVRSKDYLRATDKGIMMLNSIQKFLLVS